VVESFVTIGSFDFDCTHKGNLLKPWGLVCKGIIYIYYKTCEIKKDFLVCYEFFFWELLNLKIF
jgi:hypothetical protein